MRVTPLATMKVSRRTKTMFRPWRIIYSSCVWTSILILLSPCLVASFTMSTFRSTPGCGNRRTPTTTTALPAASEEHRDNARPSLLESNLADTDLYPRRVHSLTAPIDDPGRLPRELFGTTGMWGIHRQGMTASTTPPSFPSTLPEVTAAATEAIVAHYGTGRLSLELDGVQHLSETSDQAEHALRQLTLALAQELSTTSISTPDNRTSTHRPVTIYFHTIPQTMLAAYEYRALQRKQDGHHPSDSIITIRTLSDELPATMLAHGINRPRHGPGRHPPTSDDLYLHPDNGIVLVVQPTDYNDEHQPPGPSIGAVEVLQRLTARVNLCGAPVVLISPRFLASPYYPASAGPRNQNTQAAAFGGAEPPRQPAPWLMRDFMPPVCSWIGDSLAPTATRRSRTDRLTLWQAQPCAAWQIFHADVKARSYDYMASTKALAGRPTRAIVRQVWEEFHVEED